MDTDAKAMGRPLQLPGNQKIVFGPGQHWQFIEDFRRLIGERRSKSNRLTDGSKRLGPTCPQIVCDRLDRERDNVNVGLLGEEIM